jgi:DNA-binding phage protein
LTVVKVYDIFNMCINAIAVKEGKMNVNKLKGKLVEKSMNTAVLAEKLGISRATIYRKMRDGSFTVGEATAISKALSLTADEAHAIFFNDFVT